MEHRNRHFMQHKINLSTLVKMAIAKRQIRPLLHDKIRDRHLLNTLAVEAIKSLKKNDATCIKILVKGMVTIAIISGVAACNKDNGLNPQPPSGAGATVMAATGDNAGLLGTLNQFRSLLGDSLNTVPGKLTGRREVNWDAVPPAFTNANDFPFAFFNSTVVTDAAGRKRGLVLTNSGTAFRVDSTDFSQVDTSYANQFEAFSKKRLFAYMDNTITGVTFKIPGTSTDAFVKGFGVIFSDVDENNSTSIEYFNGAISLGVFKVIPHTASGNFSFLGVYFANAKVTSIKITSGNGILAGGVKDVSDGGTKDLVVMDDFLYNEPNAE